MVKVTELQKHKHRRWNQGEMEMTAVVMGSLLLLMASASASETDHLLHPRLSTTRSLLQAQQGCPVNFENLNYTIITSRCKGPRYPSNICCEAFKDFACPYAGELNDPTNNCATTMFSYINLYGHYPPGLFANECRDSKRGLECTESQSSNDSLVPSASAATPQAQIAPYIFLSILPSCLIFLTYR